MTIFLNFSQVLSLLQKSPFCLGLGWGLVFSGSRLHWKIRMTRMQFSVIVVMDQHLAMVMICTLQVMLGQILIPEQTLVVPTNHHRVTPLVQQTHLSFQGARILLRTLLRQKLRFYTLSNTVLAIHCQVTLRSIWSCIIRYEPEMSKLVNKIYLLRVTQKSVCLENEVAIHIFTSLNCFSDGLIFKQY